MWSQMRADGINRKLSGFVTDSRRKMTENKQHSQGVHVARADDFRHDRLHLLQQDRDRRVRRARTNVSAAGDDGADHAPRAAQQQQHHRHAGKAGERLVHDDVARGVHGVVTGDDGEVLAMDNDRCEDGHNDSEPVAVLGDVQGPHACKTGKAADDRRNGAVEDACEVWVPFGHQPASAVQKPFTAPGIGMY